MNSTLICDLISHHLLHLLLLGGKCLHFHVPSRKYARHNLSLHTNLKWHSIRTSSEAPLLHEHKKLWLKVFLCWPCISKLVLCAVVFSLNLKLCCSLVFSFLMQNVCLCQYLGICVSMQFTSAYLWFLPQSRCCVLLE